MAKILVQGWRFLPHSFATVNQFQCLELLRRPHIDLFHTDVPYWNPKWQPVYGLLDKDKEQALRDIPDVPTDTTIDATLRAGCPFDFSSGNSARTVTFATCEFGVLSSDVVSSSSPPNRPMDARNRIVTPSTWSREGLVRSGIDPAIISIVPHGVDTDIFKPPTPQERKAIRSRLGWDDFFIFLNIGAMTSNKGIPSILSSIYSLSQPQSKIRLVLKGLDSLYASTAALNNCLQGLPTHMHSTIKAHTGYLGGDMTFRGIAALYKAADAYVAPYLGEGFNLPVLEALACGLPVICTAGGPTDDFTTSETAMHINSETHVSGDPVNPDMIYLEPDPQHLFALMKEITVNHDWRNNARSRSPEYVHDAFTWRHAVDRLEQVLLG